MTLADYPDRLAHPGLAEQSLRGYLTGSIDAVLRVRDAAGAPRYLVVDYKTNWLGGFDGPELRLADYTPVRMASAMMGAHYPLQALLYAVAVHRMLRWRQPGYRPETHLGGVLYLFVRGMAGRRHPAGRRRAVRGVQLAARSGAGRRVLRSAGPRAPAAGRRWSVMTSTRLEREPLLATLSSGPAGRLPLGRSARPRRRAHRPGARPDRR